MDSDGLNRKITISTHRAPVNLQREAREPAVGNPGAKCVRLHGHSRNTQ